MVDKPNDSRATTGQFAVYGLQLLVQIGTLFIQVFCCNALSKNKTIKLEMFA